MPTITNNAESGLASGTAATTANTGGSAGTAFTVVTPGTGGSITFDNSVTIHGGLNYLISQGSTSCVMEWNTSVLGSLTTAYFRAVLRLTALPTGEVPLFQGIAADNATQSFRISLLSTGKLRIRSTGAPGTSLQDSATVLPVNAAVRLEWKVLAGAAGTIELRIYTNLESVTPAEVIGPLTSNFSTDVSKLRIGNSTSAPTMPAFRLDDVVATDAGWPGPVLVVPAPVANFTYTTSGLQATFTDTSTYTAPDAAASRLWDFGDGTTSAVANPVKTFANAGPHTVTLTVTGALGRSHAKTSTVSFNTPAESVKFTALSSATGWTPVGGVSALQAITDDNPATHVVSLTNPTDQPLGGTVGNLAASPPGTGLNLNVECDKVDAVSGTFYAQVYDSGVLRFTTGPVTVPDADIDQVTGQPVAGLNKSINIPISAGQAALIADRSSIEVLLFGNSE